MGEFTVYQDYSTDATLVSNIFIDQYMQNANDAQIKIYLYLLRVLCAHKECSISDLADQFNYTEKDVIRALKYWDKNGLIALEYDETKNLRSVRILDVVERKADTVSLASVVQLPVRTEDKLSEVSRTAETSQATEDSSRYVKRSYSTDELMAFKSKESTSELVFVVEQYLGKTLSPTELKTLYFFSDELSFSPELIDYLFDYCAGKGKKDFRYIEKVAIAWKEEGITTPKQAAKAVKKYDKTVYQIMNLLGKSAAPTNKEVEFILRWTKNFGFDSDVITEACERTVLATDSHRFEYADGILTSWFNSNVHHKADIQALDEAFERKKKAAKENNQSASNPAYKQFTQRKYDFEQLEKEILSN